MHQWIKVPGEYPEEGEIVVGWLNLIEEPCVLKFEVFDGVAMWTEIVEVTVNPIRAESRVTHWMRIGNPICHTN